MTEVSNKESSRARVIRAHIICIFTKNDKWGWFIVSFLSEAGSTLLSNLKPKILANPHFQISNPWFWNKSRKKKKKKIQNVIFPLLSLFLFWPYEIFHTGILSGYVNRVLKTNCESHCTKKIKKMKGGKKTPLILLATEMGEDNKIKIIITKKDKTYCCHESWPSWQNVHFWWHYKQIIF